MDTKIKEEREKDSTVLISSKTRVLLKIKAAQENTSQKALLDRIIKEYLNPTKTNGRKKQGI
jgi:hypothetical protein